MPRLAKPTAAGSRWPQVVGSRRACHDQPRYEDTAEKGTARSSGTRNDSSGTRYARGTNTGTHQRKLSAGTCSSTAAEAAQFHRSRHRAGVAQATLLTRAAAADESTADAPPLRAEADDNGKLLFPGATARTPPSPAHTRPAAPPGFSYAWRGTPQTETIGKQITLARLYGSVRPISLDTKIRSLHRGGEETGPESDLAKRTSDLSSLSISSGRRGCARR